MPRKFSTAVLDTLLKTVEFEFKVPLGFGEIKLPVSEYAKDWWKEKKAHQELLQAIETAEEKFKIHHPDNKAAQILRDFSLKNEEEFQKVIAELLIHLDENKITWFMIDKLERGFESIISNKELYDALSVYIPILKDELGKIREFREVINFQLQKQIANTTSLTYETTKEIKEMLEQESHRSSSSKLRIEKTVFISYRRTNFPWALSIYQALTMHGYDVFFDYQSIDSGDFERIILENIKGRAHFLIILTPSALEHCNIPGDWLRKEIETALNEKRNIVPLFLEGFSFNSSTIEAYLTGELEALKKYNGLEIPSGYFFEAIERLRLRHLNIALDKVLHPISESVLQTVKSQQTAANKVKQVDQKDLVAQELFEQGNEYYYEQTGQSNTSLQRSYSN